MPTTKTELSFSPRRLKELRERQSLTVTQLAAKLAIVENTYRNFENGRTSPRVNQVLIMLEMFGLTPADLDQLLE